jgi:hypothetical protein
MATDRRYARGFNAPRLEIGGEPLRHFCHKIVDYAATAELSQRSGEQSAHPELDRGLVRLSLAHVIFDLNPRTGGCRRTRSEQGPAKDATSASARFAIFLMIGCSTIGASSGQPVRCWLLRETKVSA